MFLQNDVESAFAGGAQSRNDRRDDPWVFYTRDAIEARQRRWAKADAEAEKDDDSVLDDPGETYVRPGPKIGRNDPCPCGSGSGKKFKKCCLAQMG